jgi:hypothetical protein
MAKKEDRKKQKKRAKEEKRAARRRDFLAAQAIANQYPAIIVDPTGGDPLFVATIQGLVDRFSFDDDSCCPAAMRAACKLFKQHGLSKLRDFARSADAAGHSDSDGISGEVAYTGLLHLLVNGLGDWLFRNLPERYTQHPLPYYYFHVDTLEDEYRIRFAFLPTVRVPEIKSPIFHSPLAPTVEMGGGTWKLGFIDHVLERACERISSTWPITYQAFQGCQLYFENCIYYEPVTLPNGQQAVRLWHFVITSEHADYVTALAGEMPEYSLGDDRCFVIGYCPLEVIRFNAVGKTLLFSRLPEHPRGGPFEPSPAASSTARASSERRRGQHAGETHEQRDARRDAVVPSKRCSSGKES